MSALVQLEQLDQACGVIAACKDLRELVDVHDRLAALAHYARARSAGSEAHANALELVMRANRRLGELTRELPQAKRGPAPETEVLSAEPTKPKGEAIAELGLTRQQVSRAEQLADLTEDDFEARVGAIRERVTKQADPSSMLSVTAATGHDGDQFSTPAIYLDAARVVIGDIELDPMTNEHAQTVVRAERFFTSETDGLKQSWTARSVWLNPPYSRGLISEAIKHFIDELAGIGEALVLTNCDPSAEWHQALLDQCAGFCLPDRRIAFELNGVPVKGNAHPQTFFYFGAKLPLFARTFAQFGAVCVVSRRRKQASKGAVS